MSDYIKIREVNRNKLITTLIYDFYYNSSSAALTNPSSGSPAHSVILIHQIHVAGGASRSATMVVVFAVCLCCVFWSRLVVVTPRM